MEGCRHLWDLRQKFVLDSDMGVIRTTWDIEKRTQITQGVRTMAKAVMVTTQK